MTIRVIVLAAMLVAACSNGPSIVPKTGEPLLAATGSLEPLATEAPTPATSPTASPTPDATVGFIDVKVTERPKASQQGDTASVTIKTQSGASCKIDVQYPSGSSEAAGLGTKKASAAGVVTWKWLIGSQTTVGTWPIVIDCTTPGHAGEASTSITVK